MAWTDSKGNTWLHRRPNGWPPDSRAPDGGVSYGWRRVSKGRVQFAQQWWTAPELEQHEGKYVRIDTECPWWTKAMAYAGHPDACPETMLEHINSFFGVGFPLVPIDDTGRAKRESRKRKT
jgi:hypothetical protein